MADELSIKILKHHLSAIPSLRFLQQTSPFFHCPPPTKKLGFPANQISGLEPATPNDSKSNRFNFSEYPEKSESHITYPPPAPELPGLPGSQETNDSLRKTKVVASLGPASWSEAPSWMELGGTMTWDTSVGS